MMSSSYINFIEPAKVEYKPYCITKIDPTVDLPWGEPVWAAAEAKANQLEKNREAKSLLERLDEDMETALDTQVGGSHYKDMAIQPIEYCQKNRLGYCESNAIKYISRHTKKSGKEDIEKAIHMLGLLLELEYNV